jgi:hypothetical protein
MGTIASEKLLERVKAMGYVPPTEEQPVEEQVMVEMLEEMTV